MLYPIFVDACPEYLQSRDGAASLLLAPLATARLITRLRGAFAAPHSISVLPTFAPTDAYRAKLAQTCAQVQLLPYGPFQPDAYEASDWLLFVDPRLYCSEPLPLPAMLRDTARLRASATHLVAMARHAGGTNEQVEFSFDGRVRRIQRYFDSATWPVLTGVACSLVSAACLRASSDAVVFESLGSLRTRLASRGVPSRDVPATGSVYELTREDEYLRLNEAAVLENASAGSAGAGVARGAVVHSAARLVGPVIVERGAVIDASATVIGPAFIGAGAHVREDALVAQSVVGDGITVPPFAFVHQRALFDAAAIEALEEPETIDPELQEPPEIDVDAERNPHTAYRIVKTLIDRSIAAVALLVLLPALALIAALIRLDSPGPIFFVDRREGENGVPFPLFKFRTMRVGADLRQRELLALNNVDGPQFKLEKDPRLTRLGRWLRPMSLDELPQLANVLLGHMSLVGPRPSPFRENQTCVPWRNARLSVRPGITGLWQVCRQDRIEGDFHQWIYFDLLYVQHMSLWLDFKIAVATILTRGGQDGMPVQWLIASPRLQT